MRAKIILFFLLLSATWRLGAQPFESGDIQLKAGIGGPNWFQLAFDILPEGTVKRKGLAILPAVRAEYFIDENVNIGLGFNYRLSRSDLYRDTFEYEGTEYSGQFGLDSRRTIVAAHAEYHPGWLEEAGNLDLYFGGMAGINIHRLRVVADSDIQDLDAVNSYLSSLGLNLNTTGATVVKPRFGAYVGLQMPISGTLGFYTEVGLGVPLVQLGLKAHF